MTESTTVASNWKKKDGNDSLLSPEFERSEDEIMKEVLKSFPLPDHPAPVQVIETLDEQHQFRLDEGALEKVLLSPDVIDKKVSVISVAGAFRKGKSFLLNFFLRYLNASEEERRSGDWIYVGDCLDGFSWRGGSERETSGILVWSRPFIMRNRDGEDTAIILMDTQGAFDSQSTVKDCATIFALSTMISSLQIYNLSQNVQEDDLQHLQLFTEYGRLALENTSAKPFQSLLFLVRDWSFPYEAEYGFQGGERLLERRLQVSEKQHLELQQLRRHIRSCFEQISCFLMPHPGLRVSTSPVFRGQISDIENEFQQQLRSFIPRLLDCNNLVLKQINGRKITCRELVEYFRAYMAIFQGEDLPEPKSMLMATAEANNLAAVSTSKAHYVRRMEDICGGDAPYMSSADLAAEHERCYKEAIKLFKATRKMGGAEFSEKFLERLDIDIEEQYESFIKVNNSKNLFKSMRTPAVLVTFMIVDYVLQEFFQLIGLDTIAGLFSAALCIAVVSLGIWAYSRYSGNLRDIGVMVDDAVTWAWHNFLSSLTQESMHRAVAIGHRLTQNGTALHERHAGDRRDNKKNS
uniref:GB1/RHD3-type G domain-containing protein n=1 Tax=Onchocerca volvulus TaxID=6282 RepID=A0A8R1XZ02_ONCVO